MASSFEKTTENVNGRKQNSRYSDIGDLPKQELLPISGYQDSDLLPLKQALQFIDELPKNISEKTQIALNNCPHPPGGLTPDESAAIHIYTMEWHPHNRCLYYLLNQKLRLENRYLLKPWFRYLKLILTALYKLPSYQGTVWRGVKLDLIREYPTGKTFIWWGFSSCTEILDVLQSEQFIGTTGPRTLFSIKCKTGRDIRHHSYIVKEHEILLLPGRKFLVRGHISLASDAHIIQLEEINVDPPLLAKPFDTSDSSFPVNEHNPYVPPSSDFNNLSINIDCDGRQKVTDCMRSTIRKCRTGRSVEIIKQDLNDEAMELIGDELRLNKTWAIVNLEASRISDAGIDHICKGLNKNRTLTALYVYDCPISDSGIYLIFQTLQQHQTLKELKLAKSHVTDKSCEAVAKMLTKNTVLEKLVLNENTITDNGVRHILHAMTNFNKVLKELDLSENQFTDECVDNVIELLKKNCTLTKLNLQDNLITKDGVERMQTAGRTRQTPVNFKF